MTTNNKFSAFGKNDIRGIYGQDISEELFFYTGKAFVRFIEMKENIHPKTIWIAVAKDARTHSTSLAKSLMKGILSAGANVLDIGLVPTPLGYYSEFCSVPSDLVEDSKVYGSLTVTASHNLKNITELNLHTTKKH